MSWADRTRPPDARAARPSMRRFSASSSMAGGSPATIPPIVLEYSEEENSREKAAGLTARARASVFEPSRRRMTRSEEHTSELQSHSDLVCRLLLEKKKKDKRKA